MQQSTAGQHDADIDEADGASDLDTGKGGSQVERGLFLRRRCKALESEPFSRWHAERCQGILCGDVKLEHSGGQADVCGEGVKQM